MAVSFIAAGAVAVSTTTTIIPAIPAHLAGDMLVIGWAIKPDTATLSAEAGWTTPANGEAAGGGGTTGVDTGPTRAKVYTREATAAGTTVTLDCVSPNVHWAVALVFRKAVGETWDVAAANGIDTTVGTPFTAVMGTNPGLTAGDHAAVFGCIPTDVTTPAQFSAETLTASGMTATVTELAEPDSTSGNDIGGLVCRATVDTGTASVAPTFTATAGGTTTNVRGPIVLVRVRAIAVGLPAPVVVMAPLTPS